jgi:hypothetical protein
MGHTDLLAPYGNTLNTVLFKADFLEKKTLVGVDNSPQNRGGQVI